MEEVNKMAEHFISGAEAKGWTVGRERLSRSENRNGGFSIYFTITKGRKYATCRFSDHSTGTPTHMIGYCGAFDAAAIDALVAKLEG